MMKIPATVKFQSVRSEILEESSQEHEVQLLLMIPEGATLGESLILTINELKTGTATSDMDYQPILRTVTFPEGATNGSTQPLVFKPIQDSLFEETETADFEITTMQGPGEIGDKRMHTVLITDDDSDMPVKETLYWIDNGKVDKIQRMEIGESAVEDVVKSIYTHAHDIKLDKLGSKLYWMESDKIARSNLDGSEPEVLVAGGGNQHDLILNIPQNKMYWTSCEFRTKKILRANLDGTEMEEIITEGLQNPAGFSLDAINKKLYWSDGADDSEPRIYRSNLDGSNVETLPNIDAPFVTYIEFDTVHQKIYWTVDFVVKPEDMENES